MTLLINVQQLLAQDLLLQVTRLTDPPTTGKHENLSVQALPPFCKQTELQAEHPKLHTEVQALVERAIAEAKGPREWRNRRISHTDRGLALNPEGEALTPASLGQVQAALDAVRAVIQTITQKVMKDGIPNDVPDPRRASAFLANLKQLVRAVQYVDGIIDPEGNARLVLRHD